MQQTIKSSAILHVFTKEYRLAKRREKKHREKYGTYPDVGPSMAGDTSAINPYPRPVGSTPDLTTCNKTFLEKFTILLLVTLRISQESSDVCGAQARRISLTIGERRS
ncbi:hypothetical protein VTL71DRAFT_1329, partial [Oculimacula yallundae]